MSVILLALFVLVGIALFWIALIVVFSIYIPTLKVRLFLDKLEFVLGRILWIGATATFFAALVIGMLERGGA